MDIRRIPYVLSIIESGGNLTKAAERMHISQPALSQILRRIEDEFGVLIFDRRKTPMTLTKSGESFVRTAQAIHRLGEAMCLEFRDERELNKGELHIGVTNFRATYVLPGILARLRRLHPGIDIVVHEASNSELLRFMEEFRTDITIGNIRRDDYHEQWYMTEILSDEELVLAVPPGHCLAAVNEIETPRLLAGEVVIIPPKSEYMREIIDEYFKEERFAPERVIETSNAEFSTRMISEGMCVAIVSDWIIGRENTAACPAYVRFKNAPMRIRTTISYPKEPYASAAARAFMASVAAGFEKCQPENL